MASLLMESDGSDYKDPPRHLDPIKCTHRQYSGILTGGNSPEETPSGTQVSTSPAAFMEGTTKYHPPGLAVLTENCLIVCTPVSQKSYHSVAGVIANHRLIQGVFQGVFWKV